MNPLEEFYKILDEGTWDLRDIDQIEKLLADLYNKIPEDQKENYRLDFKREQEAFAFSKSPEKRLTFKIAGNRKMTDETEVPFEWPDINEWNDDDFTYIKKRFEKCNNLFAFTEYGLVLYYSNNLQNNKDVTRLLTAILDLAKLYHEKSIPNEDLKHYILNFRQTLAHAFHLADNRKKDSTIQDIYRELILFSTEVHNTWDIQHKSTLRAILDLTDFATDYKKEFEKYIQLSKYLDQNYNAARELSNTYNWGAIYICDTSQRLADAIGDKRYDWQTFKAEQFEAMVQHDIETGNHAAVAFVESALAIYKQIGNSKKISDLSKRYDEVRRIFKLGEVRQELPKEETNRIFEIIRKEVAEKDSRQIIEILCFKPMYASLDKIEKMAEEAFTENSFSRFFPSSILDKYGNTVEVFVSEEEKKKFEFWQTYGFDFQIGTQTLRHFFFEALKADKINYNSVLGFLSEGWMGKSYTELFNGYEITVTPLEAISPGLKLFFDELEKWGGDNTYPANFICATDSLVTKSEYCLRFFCKLAGIPTFVDKRKNDHKIKNEKNIDELLRSLKHSEETPTGFSEDHRKFIEFVLSSKMGNNLRHRVAHGLMDAQEYTITNLILILVILLILSTYTLNPLNDESYAVPAKSAK